LPPKEVIATVQDRGLDPNMTQREFVVGAAIANAIYHATGKRIRDLPITPDKLMS